MITMHLKTMTYGPEPNLDKPVEQKWQRNGK